MTKYDLIDSRFIFLAAALAVTACGSEPDPGKTDDAGVARDAGVAAADAGSARDGGPPDSGCPPYSHVAEMACATDLEWVDLPIGPATRDHHVTFLQANENSATLYVSGGLDESRRAVRNDLWYAHLGRDGLFSEWMRGDAPPAAQMGAGVAVGDHRAYVVSGKTLAGSRVIETPIVQSIALGDNGIPDVWRAERPLPAARFHGSANIVGRWLFAIGGLEMQPGLGAPTVFRAEILDDGTLGEWAETTPMPEGRSHHASFVHDDRIFVLGGLDGSGIGFDSQTFPDYLVATLGAGGELSAWTRVTLPFYASTHSGTVIGDRVFILGGFDDGFTLLDTVRVASIEGDALMDWALLTPMPYARAHVHHTPAWNGRIYSVAGNSGNHVPVDRAVVGTLE